MYVGKGKYVQDDIKKYPGRSEDNMAGGWAGGEKGLWQFREELGEKVCSLASRPPRLSLQHAHIFQKIGCWW